MDRSFYKVPRDLRDNLLRDMMFCMIHLMMAFSYATGMESPPRQTPRVPPQPPQPPQQTTAFPPAATTSRADETPAPENVEIEKDVGEEGQEEEGGEEECEEDDDFYDDGGDAGKPKLPDELEPDHDLPGGKEMRVASPDEADGDTENKKNNRDIPPQGSASSCTTASSAETLPQLMVAESALQALHSDSSGCISDDGGCGPPTPLPVPSPPTPRRSMSRSRSPRKQPAPPPPPPPSQL